MADGMEKLDVGNSKKSRKKNFLIISLFFLLVAFLMYPYMFIKFNHEVPYGDKQDLKNIVSIINYSIHASIYFVYHLPFLYPEDFVLAKTHPLFGVSIFFKIFNWLGLNLAQSYNLYAILALFLGAWGCYLLAREFTERKWLAAVLAAFYLVYHVNYLHLVWLNFLSNFYIPYIFLFLFRFLKRQKKRYALLAVLAIFLQFLACIYHGILVLVFLLPMFIFWIIWMEMIRFKDLTFFLGHLAVLCLVLFVIFFPYRWIGQPHSEATPANAGIAASEFFYFSKILDPVVDYAKYPSTQRIFPGFVISLLILLYFTSFYPKRQVLLTGGLLAAVIAFGLLSVQASILMDILLLAFLIFLTVLVGMRWSTLDKFEKLFFLMTGLFFLLFVNFSKTPILKSITLNQIAFDILPMQGLKEFRRLFPAIIPLVIVLMTIGLERTLPRLRLGRRKIFAVVMAGLLGLIVMEENLINISEPLPIFKNHLTKPLWTPGEDTPYYKIPFKDNRVVLEIPYFFTFERLDFNSQYMLNWQFHRNYLLNGKTSVLDNKYYLDLKDIIGTFQWDFPTEDQLRQLLHRYAVNYIIFHLEWYPTNRVGPNALAKILPMIEAIKEYGKIEYRDPRFIVMKVQEFKPQSLYVRTFARHHLRSKYAAFKFTEQYDGRVRVKLNNRLIISKQMHDRVIKLDLHSDNLSIYQNRLEIELEKPMLLESTWLETIYF